MSVIQFAIKRDGSGGKKKNSCNIVRPFRLKKSGSLRQREKSWCNFITPLNGFLITASPFFCSNFAALGKSCFV